MRAIPISPAEYVSFPWKNGGGVTTDIAAAYGPGAVAGDWASMLWRLGFTSIDVPGPFSEMAGFERWQVVVGGHGLVLKLADGGEIDERAAFRPVRFAGDAPIRSFLEAGPVRVVNLIVRRSHGEGRLAVVSPDAPLSAGAGLHFVHAADGDCELSLDTMPVRVPAAHALRLEGACTIAVRSGRCVLASIVGRAAQAASAGAAR